MNKRKVIEQVVEYLREELQEVHSTAAPGAPERAKEIEQLLLMYRFLPSRELQSTDVICPAALVELELNARRAFYFIAPRGGGLVTRVEEQAVQVVTPQSPIGGAILGRHVGDLAEVRLRDGSLRQYRIISVS
ncbi:MAG: hypothetical protein A2X97_04320 [Bdellovibrionales bacterium GWA1_52_35]|nr:MAG: hypothetical protein A2X97_04320 [Bdellovibrionales bacterium GWA1_52_35]